MFSGLAGRLRRLGPLACWLGLVAFSSSAWAKPGQGKFVLEVIDAETGQLVPCRIHLKNPNGKPRRIGRHPFWHDHMVCDGRLEMDLPYGTYSFELDHGPEYYRHTGHFVLDAFADDSRTVQLQRIVDLRKEGWWSGDLWMARAERDWPLLLAAEDLQVAVATPVPLLKGQKDSELPARDGPVELPLGRIVEARTWRFGQAGNGGIVRGPIAGTVGRGTPPQASFDEFLRQARQGSDGAFDVERAASWGLPVWLSQRQVDSIQIADSRQRRLDAQDDEGGAYPRDKRRLRGGWGLGAWSQEIYYHVLNCGLRIPPSAGSGSGISPNPVGYQRMYVHCGATFSIDQWWSGLREGKVVITNGPLLRPVVNGNRLPGHVFQAAAGGTIECTIALDLATREKIDYLEIIRDGEAAHTVRLDEFAQKNGQLPKLTFDRSGWFLVRAITEQEKTYRFAASAPWYVEMGEEPRISRASCQFFLEWMDALIARSKKTPSEWPLAAPEVLLEARRYWAELLARANAD